MSYKLTVWKLTGRADEVDSVFEAECETEWQALELFDCVTRGIRGHYKAWVIDIPLARVLRESELRYAR